MTNYNTHWKTMVSVREGPHDMHYRGDFCCGAYATVVVNGYSSTEANSPNQNIQAGELVTIGYDVDITSLPNTSQFALNPPYQPGTDDAYDTARPERTPNTSVATVIPKVRYITQHPTTDDPNIVGIVLVDPFQVDPDNLQGNGPAGNDVYITHIALRGFCLVKDKRNIDGSNNGTHGRTARYEPGRLIAIDAYGEEFSGKNNGFEVFCMTNIADPSRQSTGRAETAIGIFHRVVAWGGTARSDGHRAGFPGGDPNSEPTYTNEYGAHVYGGQDILLIYLTGTRDTGYAL